ncbi:carboxymuconolactone decarboxylase family protein [Intestinirhabdus alba]|jgi:4-carboxymuconolactone decarboxylase|uniref:4-carboxymuconolactone decarboxylase n=1 Tax=Intestinirhabdus alba TaxID=2899544 RepID=A0A6L6IJB6_9ENTR|nr:carboxymuconolactone decarboxylase family protein [Intestinirhabdus alba]MTH46044.1 4-carboxymuconolactone decarboxylase [Intestinirhabdus alba]
MQDTLNKKQLAIIPVAAFTASGETEKLNGALNEALDAGMTVNEVKEILVQLYAYAGFPRSLNALGALMAILAQRRLNGIEDEIGRDASPLPEAMESLQTGADNQTRLVGKPVTGPLFEFAPAIDRFLKSHLFGDIFQRDVLDWQSRELATISALAALGGVNGQLKSHYAMCMNTGLTRAQLRAFIARLGLTCGAAVADNAAAVLDESLS